MPESFKSALISYAESSGLTPAHRAHLKRWADDDTAEEVWSRWHRTGAFVLQYGNARGWH